MTLPAAEGGGKSELLELQPPRHGGAGSASNGYHTAPLYPFARSSQYASQAAAEEEEEDEEGDGGGWHVAVLPSGFSVDDRSPLGRRRSQPHCRCSVWHSTPSSATSYAALRTLSVTHTPRAPLDTRSAVQAGSLAYSLLRLLLCGCSVGVRSRVWCCSASPCSCWCCTTRRTQWPQPSSR